MQTLNHYLLGRKKADFAAAIGVTPSQLSQYLSGYRRPSYEMMLEIASITGGAVPVESWQHVNAHGPASTPIQAPPVTVANDRGTE